MLRLVGTCGFHLASWTPYLLLAGFTEADIARSLLYTVSNDIGQIASLYAMLHKLDRVSATAPMHTQGKGTSSDVWTSKDELSEKTYASMEWCKTFLIS